MTTSTQWNKTCRHVIQMTLDISPVSIIHEETLITAGPSADVHSLVPETFPSLKSFEALSSALSCDVTLQAVCLMITARGPLGPQSQGWF